MLTYILQSSLISTLPYPAGLLSLNMVVIVLTTYVFGFKTGFVNALILGVLGEHDTSLNFTTTIIAYALVTVLTNFLSEKVFTNKSLYSNSLLCLIGSLIQILLIYGLNFSFFKNAFGQHSILYVVSWQIVLNILVSGIIFTLLTTFRKELKSYFLLK